ncbi:hypothetical protein C5167_014393 [Papaver somniferum]|uniref:FBD domain-containing protein n=1 Tax=Papaver somniferum TaxID=3469 RepID=A0A4Y7J661_PAPSO|nr:hypothetical protein C5167_014393 [Papaver somniferum]
MNASRVDHSCDDDKECDKSEELFRHLQSVRFVEFSGSRRESRWEKLILKYAESLQTMTIEYYVPAMKSKELVMSEFLSFKRASRKCWTYFIKPGVDLTGTLKDTMWKRQKVWQFLKLSSGATLEVYLPSVLEPTQKTGHNCFMERT